MQLLKKLSDRGIVEHFRKRPKDIYGLFGQSKDGGRKEQRIMDVPRTNCQFTKPGRSSTTFPLGCLLSSKESEKKRCLCGS